MDGIEPNAVHHILSSNAAQIEETRMGEGS